jgi:hypothetical protein
MNYAVIEDGVVTNIILADTKEIAEEVTGLTCIKYTDKNPVSIGWSYDGIVFKSPVIEETVTE